MLAIPGNHDSAERIAYAQGLLESQGVCFPPVYAGEVERVVLEDEWGDVAFWLLPFLKPGDVRRYFPDGEIGDDYSAALRAVLGACEIDANARNVVLSHQLVTACGVSPDRADDEIKLGGIDNVDASVYDAFDYVALGHVHRPQRVGRDTVRYSGSPLKYSFSEARYNKSVVLVELGEKAPGDAVGACVSTELIPFEPLHDVREVRGALGTLLAVSADTGCEGADDTDGRLEQGQTGHVGADGLAACGADDVCEASATDSDSAAVAPDAEPVELRNPLQDYVHITLTDEHPQLDALAKLREVYPNVMSLDYDNLNVLVNRTQTASTSDPDKLDMLELFSMFYEVQVGNELDEVQKTFARKVIAGVEHDVAKGPDGQEGGAK